MAVLDVTARSEEVYLVCMTHFSSLAWVDFCWYRPDIGRICRHDVHFFLDLDNEKGALAAISS